MRKELDNKLVKKFPRLYKDRYKSPIETCMYWGFPGDGWYKILCKASAKLEKLIIQYEKKFPKESSF